MESQVYLLVGMASLMFMVIGGISLIAHYYTLNGIKSKTVGDGQHGTARFATKKEAEQAELEFKISLHEKVNHNEITFEEMIELFKDYPDAIENTVKIADKCDVTIPTGQLIFPDYPYD